MRQTTIGLTVLMLMVGAATAPQPARADFRQQAITDPRPGDDGNGRHHDHHGGKKIYECHNCVVQIYTPPSTTSIIIFGDRQIVLNYLQSHQRPGFCAVNGVGSIGCLPLNYLRRYRVGYVLTPPVVLEPLPADLAAQLHPPSGYRYGFIDNDVVLVNQQTNSIVDAVVLQ